MKICPACELWQKKPKGEVLFELPGEPVKRLVRLRNKLLHQGEKDLTKEDVIAMILAADGAIAWLFDEKHTGDNKLPTYCR